MNYESLQTGSSSQHTMTTTATSSSLFTDKSDLSSPQPYYENWPPPKVVAPTVPLRVHPPPPSQVQCGPVIRYAVLSQEN